MKLKTIALAMLLSVGSAYAAPTLQTCSPMEVTHNGGAGLSYNLACEAGGWALKYTGSVPSGTDSVLAKYRLQASHPDGSQFTQNRAVRLPSPAMLGQALLREAVVLDRGDLAMRDCQDFNCTLYRPLGGAEKLAKATITMGPETKRLTDETSRLTAELAQRQVALAAQDTKVAALEQELRVINAKLSLTEKSLTDAQAALETAKEQYRADISGLLDSDNDAKAAPGPSTPAVTTPAQEIALAEAERTIASLLSEHALKVGELEASLAAAKHQLALAQQQTALPKSAQDLTVELAKVTAEREAAQAEVKSLAEKLAAVAPAMEKLSSERLDALQGARRVATEMLDALDKFQELQSAKAEADKALEATTNRVMELSTKLQAANLARDLSMQAATTAHADADTQNLKNQELAQQLGKAKDQLRSLISERYDLYAKLQATKVELEAVSSARSAGGDEKEAIKRALTALTLERNTLSETLVVRDTRIAELQRTNSAQSQEIDDLRKQLQALKNNVTQNTASFAGSLDKTQ